MQGDGWTVAGLCEIHQRPRQKNGVCPSCYFKEWYARKDVIARVTTWKRDNRVRHLAGKRASRARHAEQYRQTVRRHRVLAAGVLRVPYTEAEVYERHGWVCYICGGPIDASITDRSAANPSFDHVIPISRGGADVLDNVRPAHKGCNSHKGRRLLSELAA
jgi:5-methylcytosine-specific restriction endonuclease McrA